MDLFHSALNRVVSDAEKRMTAHGIKKPGLAKVSGAHLSDAANEPNTFAAIEASATDEARQAAADLEAAYLAGDRARNDAKATAHQREADKTQALELARAPNGGYLND